MTVPVTGAVILALAAWFFVFTPRLLYPATIISIPFTATAVINFPWAGAPYGTEKSVMAWQLFAVLWVCREAFSGLPQWRKRGWFLTRRARFWLLVFIAAVAASLTVPLILNGTSWVESWTVSPVYSGPAMIPLRFSLYNVTQSAYLVFGVSLTIFVAAKNWHPAQLFQTLRLYVGSCVFAAAWGLLQLVCRFTGHAYPAYVFNTSKNSAALGYTQTITVWNLVTGRISSVALEPSVLAGELLFAFVVLIVCLGLQRPILSRRWTWFGIGLIGTVLLISTSATAYIGIFAALLLAGVAVARAGDRRWKYYLVLALALLAAGAVLAETVPFASDFVRINILGKYQTFSGVGRLDSQILAARDFLRYPILGAGWLAVQSWDLVFLILANTGLMGGVAFGAFLILVFRELWRLTSRRQFPATVLLPAFTLAIMLAEAASLDYSAGHDWLFLGLAAGAIAAAKAEPSLGAATAEQVTPPV